MASIMLSELLLHSETLPKPNYVQLYNNLETEPYFIFLRTVSENVRKPLAKLLKISQAKQIVYRSLTD